jgi:hypothetical protein
MSDKGQETTIALHPKATFKVGPLDGQEARESGLRLKASVAPQLQP